jgi:hypothetical protein
LVVVNSMILRRGLLTLAAAAVFAGCGTGGDQSFSTPTYPFSFDYPGGWTLTRGSNFNYSGGGAALRSVSVALKEPYDQVTVTQYRLKKTLPSGVNGYRPEIDRIVARVSKQAGGTTGHARVVKYGGVPGYQYVVRYPGGEGVKLENLMTFLFKGSSEFQISCQSAPQNREALRAGCRQLLESLEFR